jgi:hypothetical protein
MRQSFTAKAAKGAEENKSFTAEAAKVEKEQKSFDTKDTVPSSLPLLPNGEGETRASPLRLGEGRG